MNPHDTTRPDRPGSPRATAPPTRAPAPQGPTLGGLIDAYLQDYQVRQFRSLGTARGRVAHLAAYFGRDGVGDVSVVRRARCWSCIAISSVRAIQRRASARRVCLADAVGVSMGPGRSPAQRVSRP